MALLEMNFESRYLNQNQPFSMILPDKPREVDPDTFYAEQQDLPVVWLLHGTFGDHTDWVRKTNVERYASQKGVVVVMPSALNSNYANWSGCMLGYDMDDYLLKELMPLVHHWFPASSKREKNFIAGLSMGGRGTVKTAVAHPELFAAAAVLSASPKNLDVMLTPEYLASDDPMALRYAGMVANAGGLEKFLASDENVWRGIDERAGSGTLPRLLFGCGADDAYVMDDLVVFRAHAEEIGLDAEFVIREGFTHEWDFWDLAIKEAFEFFGLPDVTTNQF